MVILYMALLMTLLTITMLIVCFSLVCSISPMPTSGKAKRRLIEALKKYKTGNILYDFGSGWGTLVFAISDHFPEYRVTGFERSPVPYLYSLLANRFTGRTNCELKYADCFKLSLSETDIVVCYLCTSLMNRLREKLDHELKPGALVISNTFAVPGWQPIETITVNDIYRSKIYIYQQTE